MIRTILLASAASLALTGGAFAADLPARVQAPAPVFVPPAFTWTGFYAGVNAGVGFNAGDDRDDTVVVGPNGFIPTGTVIRYGDNSEDAAFTGGGFIGYNYQFANNFVLGAEADLQFVGLDDDDMRGPLSVTPAAPGFAPLRRGISGVDWFGTARIRAGYAFDRALIYATGGLAYGGGDAARFETATGDRVLFEDDDVGFGWTLGAGVDYAFTNNLIVGIEGLYVNLDRDTDTNGLAGFVGANPIPAASESNDDNVEFGVVRARLSYKF
ncbi:outer membrane protein [Salinarimonas ramus]|uniref:Porin n=1 Tax=Salinarimonas ramus TaxID=690164 RepID=A0A917Q698_9HYPH|nr:outer membrane beta-barrel protein [Salinarimonas ramus]GGK29257.1 porin [Salinarimonas ramus]